MRMCYVHHGPYVAVDGKEGCQDSGCLSLRGKQLKPYYAKDPAVPGGAHEKAAPKEASVKETSSKKPSQDKASQKKTSTEKTASS